MPISIEWDQQTQIWTITTGETFSLAEISDLLEHTDWKGSKLYLWDLRGLMKGPDSSDEIHDAVGIVKRSEELWSGSRVGILVAREFDFGIGRMFGALADQQIEVDYDVFREEQSALEWLQSPREA